VVTILIVFFGNNASSIFGGIFTFLVLFAHQFTNPYNETIANEEKRISMSYKSRNNEQDKVNVRDNG